jgi:heat shock protein HslJ
MHRFILSVLLLLSLHVSARRIAPIRKDLLDGKYTLQKMWDGEQLKTVSGVKSAIVMNSKENRMTANFGCNTMSGDFAISNYMIIPVQLMSTEMFCNDKINQIETSFGKQIATANRFTIEGNVITFFQEEQAVLVFKKLSTSTKKKKKKK